MRFVYNVNNQQLFSKKEAFSNEREIVAKAVCGVAVGVGIDRRCGGEYRSACQ